MWYQNRVPEFQECGTVNLVPEICSDTMLEAVTIMLDGATYVLSEICYHYIVVEMLCRNVIPKPDTTNIVPQLR